MTKKKKIILISIAILIIASTTFALTRKPKVTYTTEDVKKEKITQTVSETGSIKSLDEIELNFQNSGKISKIYVKVGDKVSSSQKLAELNYKDLTIRAKNAKASLDIARANLNKLVSGATSYDINVQEANVAKAETDYNSSLNELEEVKKNALNSYSQTETNALISIETNISKSQVALDNINTILTNDSIDEYLGVRNSSILNTLKSSYEIAKYSLSKSRSSLSNAKISKSRSDIKFALNDTLKATNDTFNALANCYQTLESSITSSGFSQTSLDGYKTIISGQETIVSASISSIQTSLDNLQNTDFNNSGNSISGNQQVTSAQSRVDSAYSLWQISKAQLEQLKAPAKKQDITLYTAQVRQAEASLETINNDIENSIIKAPMDGTITRVEYKNGEQFSMTKPVIYMMSQDKLNIEVDISESDISKVRIDNSVEISLDALTNDKKLYGKVYDIDPAATTIQDVIYYKTKIAFDIPENFDAEIKPGMTANVIIKTQEKENVIIIPSRAIIEKNGDGKFVKILENENPKELSITTGLYGDDGMVEILSGLEIGQKIITATNK